MIAQLHLLETKDAQHADHTPNARIINDILVTGYSWMSLTVLARFYISNVPADQERKSSHSAAMATPTSPGLQTQHVAEVHAVLRHQSYANHAARDSRSADLLVSGPTSEQQALRAHTLLKKLTEASVTTCTINNSHSSSTFCGLQPPSTKAALSPKAQLYK
jgi:hypothetical protein